MTTLPAVLKRLGLTLFLMTFVFGIGHATVSMTITIKRISDNAVQTEIKWPAVALPATWVLAQDYIQLDSTLNSLSDGIEIYTDNTAPEADPRYIGTVSSTTPVPAGLIHSTQPRFRIPTAWRITDLFNPEGGPPLAVDPNGGGQGFLWLYNEDRAQVQNNQGAATFQHADAFITVENVLCPNGGSLFPCIHFAQGPFQFGAALSPNYIYLQADFSNALPGATYRTSTLRIEAFSQ